MISRLRTSNSKRLKASGRTKCLRMSKRTTPKEVLEMTILPEDSEDDYTIFAAILGMITFNTPGLTLHATREADTKCLIQIGR